jgi:hypothetical protein
MDSTERVSSPLVRVRLVRPELIGTRVHAAGQLVLLPLDLAGLFIMTGHVEETAPAPDHSPDPVSASAPTPSAEPVPIAAAVVEPAPEAEPVPTAAVPPLSPPPPITTTPKPSKGKAPHGKPHGGRRPGR